MDAGQPPDASRTEGGGQGGGRSIAGSLMHQLKECRCAVGAKLVHQRLMRDSRLMHHVREAVGGRDDRSFDAS